MLVLLRTATSFLPTPTTLSARSSSAYVRKLHYNSLWARRRGPLKASEDNDNSSTTETAEANSSESESDIDPWAKYQNRNNIRDQVVSAISKDGGIKVTACTIRNLVNDLMIQHTMTDIPIQAIGRTMTCALLMANGMQEEQTVQITLNSKSSVLELFARE